MFPFAYKTYIHKLLYEGIVSGNRIAVERALHYGADVNAKSRTGYPSIINICLSHSDNRLKIADLLIEAGADINYISPSLNMTPILDAVYYNDFEFADYLLKKGADINISPNPPLGLLADNSLLDEKINPSEKLRWLLNHGFDPNTRTDDGSGLLELACMNQDIAAVQLLLAAGANPNVYNKYDLGVLDYAKNEELRTLLKSYGAERAISISSLSGFRDGGYVYVTGLVKNNLKEPITYVKVKVKYHSSDSDDAIDSDWTYAVDSSPLDSGDSKSFKIMSDGDNIPDDFHYGVYVESYN